jgi:hypothetical protein
MLKSLFVLLVYSSIFFTISCKSEEDPTNDNPDVISVQVDTVLKSFYPKPSPSATFEQIYRYNFSVVNCSFDINLNWPDPAETHGIYMHFNNSVGDALTDASGFIKSFNSGIKIDSTLAGYWTGFTDGKISLDYVSNPLANKGNLAGQGDKYIVFRAFSDVLPYLKYYGWLRVSVSANGRDVKVISIGYQRNANTSLRTGEL